MKKELIISTFTRRPCAKCNKYFPKKTRFNFVCDECKYSKYKIMQKKAKIKFIGKDGSRI